MGSNKLVVNRVLRPNKTQKTTLKGTRVDSLLKVMLKKMALTIN